MWRDLFSDTEKELITTVNGQEFPWKKLSVEQSFILENKYKKDMRELEKRTILMRMQNADATVTETDLVRLPEDVYLKLAYKMSQQILSEEEDFQSGVRQKSQSQSTGSLNTQDISSTNQDTSETSQKTS